MKTVLKVSAITAALVAFAAFAEKPAEPPAGRPQAKAAAKPALKHPKDYRSWAHAKSMVIGDKSHPLAGFHHVYVSPKALNPYKKGEKLPEGSEFAVSFYEVVDDKGVISQGAFKMLAVMKKDKGAQETGGWRYGAFDGEGKAMELDTNKNCYECHTAQKDKDFIFSQWQ